jgi:hypothetical protein
MAYPPLFGFVAGALAGEVVVDLVGAGTFTLNVGKFALSPITRRDIFGDSAITLLPRMAWKPPHQTNIVARVC